MVGTSRERRGELSERARLGVLLLVALGLVATGCSSEEGQDSTTDAAGVGTTTTVAHATTTTAAATTTTSVPESRTISFWTTETEPAPLETIQGIIAGFTTTTGINVELVPVDQDALYQVMLTNAAAGALPDVVFHPLDFTTGWANAGILDVDAASDVIDDLGVETFSEGALALASVDGVPAAVPSDGWGQLLIYRKDLFDEAGLDKPDTFDKILAAAEELNDPGNDFFGITVSNDPDAVFTQQTWEYFAVANGCDLVDSGGAVTLDSPNCVEAIDFYATLINDYSPPGLQNLVGTRSTYLAGRTAMMSWPPFIMDEMAGLRFSTLPTCPECVDNIAYLAENSDFVSSLTGPSGEPAQYGQVSYLGIGMTENTEASKQFVEYWLSESYLEWLSVSSEGKFPMRRGTLDDPTAYVEDWLALTTGVDEKGQLRDYYDQDVISGLFEGSNDLARWGFAEGQGELVTAIYTTLVVPRTLSEVLDGTLTAEEAAAQMQDLVQEEQRYLR
jgi:multiple sugar transport system substrate-binding protein